MIGTDDLIESAMDERVAELELRLAVLQQQFIQAQKMSSVGVLAASITHEFNNILMTATRDKAFDKILLAGQRAAKITTGMLSYARQQVVRREPMDLTMLVDDVLVLVEKDLQRFRIKLVT